MIRHLALTVLAGLAILATTPALAGPPPDPRQMSGIPRVDPQLAAGSVTVRVLDGGFESPATEAEVTLELTGPDGKTETRKATTDAQGRATFDGLEPFIGGKAIAKTSRAGSELVSQPMDLMAEGGSRVMLVAGAEANASGAAPKHGQAGGPEVPNPGTAFVLEGTPAGELVVGTFDLDARKPIGNIVVTLKLTSPSGEVKTRTQTSDARGKVAFDKLLPPDTEAGTKLQVSASLGKDQPVKESSIFEMDKNVGMAVVLANGELRAEPVEPTPPRGRPQVPGPRIMPTLPNGTVRVRMIDANDAPVAGQAFEVVKKDQSGNDVTYGGKTDKTGHADVEVDVQSDAVYLVRTRYDGGPYSSTFFQVDKRGGIAVDMRVFETTSDITRVRSVVQFDVDGLENDLARVVQLQDMMVGGDEAFWPEGGMQILPAEGGKNVTVLPMSEEWLNHEEKAPYATLAGPIPPGELTRLAIAYVIEHDGTAKVDFSTKLDSLETSVLVGADQTLTAAGATKSDHASPIADKTVWLMGPRGPGAKIQFSVGGLPRRNPIYRTIGLIGGLALGLVVIGALVTRPRADPLTRLRARRDALLAELDGLPPSQKTKRDKVIAALDHLWRQLDVLERKA